MNQPIIRWNKGTMFFPKYQPSIFCYFVTFLSVISLFKKWTPGDWFCGGLKDMTFTLSHGIIIEIIFDSVANKWEQDKNMCCFFKFIICNNVSCLYIMNLSRNKWDINIGTRTFYSKKDKLNFCLQSITKVKLHFSLHLKKSFFLALFDVQ